MEVKRFYHFHDLGAEFLVFSLVLVAEALVFVQGRGNPVVLKVRQFLETVSDLIKRLKNLRLKRGLHGSQ